MLIYIMKRNKIETFSLPNAISGNYWIFDKDFQGEKRSLIHVTAVEDRWQINSNSDTKIVSGNQYIDFTTLHEYNFYNLALNNGKEIVTLYCCPSYENTYKPYYLENEGTITIGRNSVNTISFNSPNIKENHAIMTYKNRQWQIQIADEKTGIFVNKLYVTSAILKPGDIVFLMGLKIVCMGEFLIINNPNNLVSINETILKLKNIMPIDNIPVNDNEEIDDYEEIDYFFRAPRFKTKFERQEISIDAPPNKEEIQSQPFILTFGPMAMMAIVTLITLTNTISNIIAGSKDWLSSLPSFAMTISMLAATILWPTLNRNWQKKEKIRKENLRQTKYTNYINLKAQDIKNKITQQKNALEENLPSMEECQNIIINRKRNLWERKIDSEDFLAVRLGTGNMKPNLDILFPEEKFSLFEDELVNNARSTITNLNTMHNVPISISLAEKYITAVVGTDKEVTTDFINSLILQTVTLQSYEDVKIVILTTEENEYKWEYVKSLPHCWDNDKNVRYFASTSDEIKQVSTFLETELNKKIEEKKNKRDKNDVINAPYFIIVTDDLKIIRNSEIIKQILNAGENIGFSLLIQNDRLTNLPNECFEFISIDKGECTVFENELVAESNIVFTPNNTKNINIKECCEILSNIPIKLEVASKTLPKSLGFLEMFQVGNVSQLNILNTWKKNNPAVSLAVPVGIDEAGEQFKLDLHEKFHGPHGLVAGMTGSGKSEFIITYILSLAVNFHPNEVSFVIIDYKGGGLAGAFHNKETGIKLPHLIGTLTNLETNEMNRAIASIDSELRRRQKLFNETRDKLNESTIDIYKYQRLYREKRVTEPLPHLFIISDEFAELKSQQPEFLDNLISIARIGRSLGVHLILCTQKPAGVVNDQIWSNSKFRVCLKVQDKSDSMDMIKREDAASLKEAGRFYLQVGYNELFKLGQAAWCGTPYYDIDKIKKNVDTSINFIDNTGYTFKNVDNSQKGEVLVPKGDELTNIVSYLDTLAKEQNIKTNPLWPDSMPEYINIEALKKKYSYTKEPFKVNIPYGEYDIPKEQTQKLLSANFSEKGNMAIYGNNSNEREHVLNTFIYSAITNYSVDELNMYIIDLGAETLKIFSKAPQIDDVILLDEKDKIKSLIKMIKEMLTKRKKNYADYNGNYYEYCIKSGKTDPTIILIINNYDAFIENFPDYEETFATMLRDCSRYGINLLFTVSGTTSLRYRLRQNFNNLIMLQMNEQGDYSYILPNAKRMQPSKKYGRGLIDMDGEVYELQVASITNNQDEEKEIIKETNEKLSELYKTVAKEVPVLPNIVNSELLAKNISNIEKVPIGIDTESLKKVYVDLPNTHLITSNETKNFEHFIKEYLNLLVKIPNTQVLFADSTKEFKDLEIDPNVYSNKDFDKIFQSTYSYLTKLYKVYESKDKDIESLTNYTNVVLIINNLKSFVERLKIDNVKKFEDMIIKANETKKVIIILIDSANNIKSLEYSDTYKLINPELTTGIWIGNGLYDQNTIRLTKMPKYIKQEIKNNFGYYVKNGNPIQIKILCDVDLDEVEEDK